MTYTTNEEFVRCKMNDGREVKVLLDKDTNIYPAEYKGIKFYIYRNIDTKYWTVVETSTGLSFANFFHITKKIAIQNAKDFIDKYEEFIASDVQRCKARFKNGNKGVLTKKKYMKQRYGGI